MYPNKKMVGIQLIQFRVLISHVTLRYHCIKTLHQHEYVFAEINRVLQQTL